MPRGLRFRKGDDNKVIIEKIAERRVRSAIDDIEKTSLVQRPSHYASSFGGSSEVQESDTGNLFAVTSSGTSLQFSTISGEGGVNIEASGSSGAKISVSLIEEPMYWF